MKYTETLPSSEFSELIANYWAFEVPPSAGEGKPFAHETMPENNVSIVFIHQPYFQGIRLLGPQIKMFKQQVYPGSVYLGIRFNPWVKMDGVIDSKAALINQTSASPEYLKEVFREIEVQTFGQEFPDYSLLETGLLRLIENQKVMVDPLVKYICLQLKKEIGIEALVKTIPLSIRPIQKRFKATTGISMSRFRSIDRLQKTVKMIYLEQASVTSAAHLNDYADHSHFLNTFRKYMDSSVKDFLAHTEKIDLSITR